MSNELHKIGEPISDVSPSVFELVIEDHVPFVDPNEFGLTDTDSVNPADYFITSGDAVEKAKVLERAVWQLAGDLRKQSYEIIEQEQGCTPSEAQAKYRDGVRPSDPLRFSDYENAVWKAAGQSRRLLNALKKAKGDDCFLETEWDNHHLLCIPKNPRK